MYKGNKIGRKGKIGKRYVCQLTDGISSRSYSLGVESVNHSVFELDLLV
jgi:hypothetical protein